MNTILLIILLLIAPLSNIFSQGYYLYVSVNDNKLKPKTSNSVVSSDSVLNVIFNKHQVNAYYQSFPGAKTPGLSDFYEIHFSGDIDSLENELRIKNIYSEIYRCDYYTINANCVNPVVINDEWIVQGWVGNTALELLDAECAWTITTGSSDIIVGVVDTEFDTYHEDLENQIISVDDPNTSTIHGTVVASCVAAETNNGKGIAGIGYNTKMKGYITSGMTIWNKVWKAYQEGVDIINVSWSGFGFAPPVQAEVNEIVANGTVLVLGAGNYNPPVPFHSLYANIPGVINVSGVNPSNLHGPTGFAHNQYVDVCALSNNVDACWPGNQYVGWPQGTSFAAPQVAGVAALVLSVNPCLMPADVESIIKSTTDPIADAADFSGLIGTGRVNAYNAVLLAQTYGNIAQIQINTLWDVNRYIENLIVESGATLTVTSNIKLGTNGGITINDGGRIEFIGSTVLPCECALNIDIYGDMVIDNNTLNLLDGSVLNIFSTGALYLTGNTGLCLNENALINIEPGGELFINNVDYASVLLNNYQGIHNLLVSNQNITQDLWALNSITTEGIVETQGIVTATAGREIIFTDGFKANPGFVARIDENINQCPVISCAGKSTTKNTPATDSKEEENHNQVATEENNIVSGNLQIQIFPNPSSSGLFNVKIYETRLTGKLSKDDNTSYSINIYDSFGQIVQSITNSETSIEIDISDLSKGAYFIHVIDNINTKTIGKGILVR